MMSEQSLPLPSLARPITDLYEEHTAELTVIVAHEVGKIMFVGFPPVVNGGKFFCGRCVQA